MPLSNDDVKVLSQVSDLQKSAAVEPSGADDSAEKQKPSAVPKKSRFIVKMVSKEVH